MWSVGVILFQMLYGRRPFGHDLTQHGILQERAILNAREVHFPARPAVSNDAKVCAWLVSQPRDPSRDCGSPLGLEDTV